jgi:hypothetical protein
MVKGLNRGDISPADDAFASNCVIHINGSPDPYMRLEDFKVILKGLLFAFLACDLPLKIKLLLRINIQPTG